MQPIGSTAKAKFYSDGSRMDEKHQSMVRFGLAFVALDPDERIVAIARGTPPHWVTDIPGAEAWALVQAGLKAEPGSTFRSDCKPCVDAIAQVSRLERSCYACGMSADCVWYYISAVQRGLL